MLVYALNENKLLVHIDDVQNGKACNCVCPECKSGLIARNAGSIKAHSFAHAVEGQESRNCHMTALHLYAQRFVKSQPSILLPSRQVNILNQTVEQPSKSIQVSHGEIEVSLDKFRIDVVLQSEIGPIYIEIKVKNGNSDEKVQYFKSNRLISLEYNLERYVDSDFDDVAKLLINPEPIANWIFPWTDIEFEKETREQLEAQAEAVRIRKEREVAEALKAAEEKKQLKEKERQIRLSNLIRSIESIVETITNLGYFQIPAYSYLFKYVIRNKPVTLNAVPYNGGFNKTQNIRISKRTKSYIRADCEVIKKNNEARDFSIIFSLTGRKPKIQLKEHEQAIWAKKNSLSFDYEWLSTPTKTEHNSAAEYLAIKAHYHELAKQDVRDRIEMAAHEYIQSKSGYSYKDYLEWKEWLSRNRNALSPKNDYSANPTYKNLLNFHGEQRQLWCFGRWHILVLAEIAEIIDQVDIGNLINPHHIFEQLTFKYPLTDLYYKLRDEASSFGILNEVKHLLDPVEIIFASLTAFITKGAICLDSADAIRVYNLRIHVQPSHAR